MYSIDRFYVGVVKPSKSMNEMPFAEAIRKRAEIDEIIENGGIPLDLTDTIPGNDSALTVFIKTGHYDLENEDVFMCLHNMKEYYNRESEVVNSCDSMVPLEEVMPRPESIACFGMSIQDARETFDNLFKKQKKSKSSKEEHAAGLFFVGDLSLCTSVLVDGELKRINIPQQYLLDQSPSKLISEYGRGKEVPEVDYEIGINRTFRRYRTVFQYLYDNTYYNLYDHQKYPSIERDPIYGRGPLSVAPTDSYCSDIKPLETGKKADISYDEASKIYRKYIKRNY